MKKLENLQQTENMELQKFNKIWNYFNIIKPILKTLLTVFLSISIHIFSVKFYNYYCISDGWFTIFYSMLYIPTPQCRILLDVIKYTSDLYILFWTTLFSSILLNYKIVKNSLITINHNIKYFKN
jgi:hypothetical protein